MRSPVTDYLAELLHACEDNSRGEVADYIEELSGVDVDKLSLAVCVADGDVYGVGDHDHLFTIQSMSKPFVYALALATRGVDDVIARVGVEPSGDSFNRISLDAEARPRNPMINIGALTTTSLMGDLGMDADQTFARIQSGLSAFAGRHLEVDEEVFTAEFKSSYRNLALAHMVRSHNIIEQEPRDVVREYTRQCALQVTVKDLAVMAMTLGQGGLNPVTGEQVVEPWVARRVLSIMTTCGMYDAAGDWMTSVGMPAKSGVSGGILATLPGEAGVAVHSPKLDRYGNSVRGVRVFERMSQEMGMHMMDVPSAATGVLRSAGRVDVDASEGHRVQLQGPMYFGTVEHVLTVIADLPDGTESVVLDLTRVTSCNRIAHRMMMEGIRRLREDGHHVIVVDPEEYLEGAEEQGADLREGEEIVAL